MDINGRLPFDLSLANVSLPPPQCLQSLPVAQQDPDFMNATHSFCRLECKHNFHFQDLITEDALLGIDLLQSVFRFFVIRLTTHRKILSEVRNDAMRQKLAKMADLIKERKWGSVWADTCTYIIFEKPPESTHACSHWFKLFSIRKSQWLLVALLSNPTNSVIRLDMIDFLLNSSFSRLWVLLLQIIFFSTQEKYWSV